MDNVPDCSIMGSKQHYLVLLYNSCCYCLYFIYMYAYVYINEKSFFLTSVCHAEVYTGVHSNGYSSGFLCFPFLSEKQRSSISCFILATSVDFKVTLSYKTCLKTYRFNQLLNISTNRYCMLMRSKEHPREQPLTGCGETGPDTRNVWIDTYNLSCSFITCSCFCRTFFL